MEVFVKWTVLACDVTNKFILERIEVSPEYFLLENQKHCAALRRGALLVVRASAS